MNMNPQTDKNSDNCNADGSVESPPRHRRRSSFFERRSIVPVPEPAMDIDDNDTQDDEKDEHLNQYYNLLMKEKDLWKKELQHRRGQLHDAELQLNMEKKSDKMRINYNILSNEDIEFLRGKPNLSDIADSVRKFQNSSKETCAIYQRAKALDDIILNGINKKLEKITKNLLDSSAGISAE